MVVHASDGSRLLLLLTLGAASLLAGLFLMVRSRPAASQEGLAQGPRVIAFSGGMLVFLVGTAFLAVVVFVDRARPRVTIANATMHALLPEYRPVRGQVVQGIAVEAHEVEGNDTAAAANRTPLGTAIDARLTKGDVDYYAVDIPAGAAGEIVANALLDTGSLRLTLLDDAGEALSSRESDESGTAAISVRIERPSYYVLVSNEDGADVTYQLTVAARRN